MTADSGGYVLVDLGPSPWIFTAALAVLLVFAVLCVGLFIRRGRRDGPVHLRGDR